MGALTGELRDGVDEAVDRQSPGQGIRIGYEAFGDGAGVQGIAAVDQLRGEGARLHSRKLRAFNEPPFR